MSLKIKIKLNQPYTTLDGKTLDEKAIGTPVDFSFDEAMAIVQAGFGEQVEEKAKSAEVAK